MPGAKLIKGVARRILRKELARQERALAEARAELAHQEQAHAETRAELAHQERALAETRAELTTARALGHDKAHAQRLLFDYRFVPRSRFGYGDLPSHRQLERLLRAHEPTYRTMLESLLSHRSEFEAIPVTSAPDSAEPFWNNTWFPTLDAMSLYGLLARFEPRHYVEVGSGNSTKFARRAVRDRGLRTRIISIDPAPRAEIDRLCDEIHRVPAEDLGARLVEWLSGDDLLFVDSSHRSFMNTDVTVFFLEVLPTCPGAVSGACTTSSCRGTIHPTGRIASITSNICWRHICWAAAAGTRSCSPTPMCRSAGCS